MGKLKSTLEQNGFPLLEVFFEHSYAGEGNRRALGLAFVKLIMHEPLSDQLDMEIRVLHLPYLPVLQGFGR
jgi:hypothetical protein